ncbi:MAG: type II secretion system protein GspG, partial [Planctomycetota bacterium]
AIMAVLAGSTGPTSIAKWATTMYSQREVTMKRILSITCLMVAASFSAAQETVRANDVLQMLNDLTDVLKTVKDKATAEAGLPKLKALEKKYVQLTKVNRADVKFSNEEKQLLSARSSLLTAELNRIDNVPEAPGVLKELAFYTAINASKIDSAKVRIMQLDAAVAVHKIKNGAYPDSLNALTKGDNRSLESADSLLDPWKKPYQYDVAAPKNMGAKPDIWTVSPTHVVIGNWGKK